MALEINNLYYEKWSSWCSEKPNPIFGVTVSEFRRVKINEFSEDDCLEDAWLMVGTYQDGAPAKILFYPVGDCCSRTWIEEVYEINSLIGHTVLGGEAVFAGSEERDEWEYIKSYAYNITTEVGVCTIAYRNSSNGYYGGELELYDLAK